jgi:cobalt-zinc-cadmium resistance protein CzcA
VAAGWLAFKNLPIDAFPDVSSTQVKIIMKAPGMTPEEIESRIALPIEVEMLGIPKQRMLRSVSKYGIVDVTIDFDDGTDIYWARQQVSERLAGISADLPGGISGGMAPITTPLGEMFMFTVEGENLSLEERRSLLDWVIRPALRSVVGVADVNALGGKVRSFEVLPDPVKLAAVGCRRHRSRRPSRPTTATTAPAGWAKATRCCWCAPRAASDAGRPARHRRQERQRHDGAPGRRGTGARRQRHALRRGHQRRRSGEAVEGLVLGLAGANAQKVVEGVTQKLEDLKPTLPKGVEIKVFYNRASLVEKAVGTVSKALMEATVLVLVLLGAFLGNLRAAITVAMVLPLSALATFILMRTGPACRPT